MFRHLPITAAGTVLSAACYLGAGYLACHLTPAPVTLGRELAHPHRWIAQYGPDVAVAGVASAVLWLCAVWVAVGLTAWYLSMLPGLAGRCGSAVVRRVLPGAVRRLLVASTGVTVLLSPLPAVAAAGPTPTVPAPSWPVGQPAASPTPSQSLDQPPVRPAPGWPTDRTPAMPAAGTPDRPAAPAGSVTVAPGDSLWTIAATALGPAATEHRIAVAWPYWYRANRSVIGRDPGLIRPGTELIAPTARSGR